ncbi:Mov34/MPN/PAD-1 family protein [Nocardia sp. AG03]|uniref:Mov34/MPN/PAD-1 family protein n=1 Tax=Nocardia sp. AG03 TaxID=3025312 RepID=UPI002418B8CC|nr:Mov34/MPN/PAD-1 family protein [Nocardia sp. AG03]
MFRHISLVDSVLAAIDQHVAAPPPERGGGLLGPLGLPLITTFLPDLDAISTATTFRLSPAFQRALTRIEHDEPDVELKGIVHSHAENVNRPSAGDLAAFADSLRRTPWLGRYVTPIVTRENQRTGDHQVLLPHGMLSVFVAAPTARGAIEVRPARVQILPIARDCARLATALVASASAPRTVDVEGVVHVAVMLRTAELELTLLFPLLYPTQAPIVLAERRGGSDGGGSAMLARFGVDHRRHRILPLPLTWDLAVPAESRLARALYAVPDPMW